MTSVTIVSADKYMTKQCLSELCPDLLTANGNGRDQCLKFYKKVRIKQPPGVSHEGESSGYNEASNMDYDDGDCDSSMQPSDEYRFKRKHGPPESHRMKYLKGAEESTSYCHGELPTSFDEASGSFRQTQGDERYVDLWVVNTNGKPRMLSKTCIEKCIPDRVLIVPVSHLSNIKDIDDDVIRYILEARAEECAKNNNKHTSTLIVVDCSSDKDNTTEKRCVAENTTALANADKKCKIGELRKAVHTILQDTEDDPSHKLPEEFLSNQSLFIAEDSLKGNSKSELQILTLNKMIFRFEVAKNKKNYICIHPDQLIERFTDATLTFNSNYKVKKETFVTAMKVPKKDHVIVLESLRTLDLIQFSSKIVCILHQANLDNLQSEQLAQVEISENYTPHVLRISTDKDIPIERFLVELAFLGWDVNRSQLREDCDSCVLSLHKDGLNVVVWFDILDGTSAFIYLVENEINDTERDYINRLRCELKQCMGQNVKVSVCKRYKVRSNESRDVNDLITDTLDGEHCEWIDAKDPRLYYIEDAPDIMKPWVNSEQDDVIKQVLHNQLSESVIAMLSTIFGKESRLFFIEQGLSEEEINNIECDFMGNKTRMSQCLSLWKKKNTCNANLYSLGKAISESHNQLCHITRFHDICAGYLGKQSLPSLI